MAATRRGVLGFLLAVSPAARVAGDDTARHARRLSELLASPPAAHSIAAAYLRGVGLADSARAANALRIDTVLAPLDHISDDTAARAYLGRCIRDDFAAGAVIEVDGWRLSRTEVGACLLVASVL
jgi:hypothetical protein